MRDPVQIARERVARAIREHGAARVARAIGLSREALLAFAGDLGGQRGTEAYVVANLGKLDSLGAAA